MNFARPPESSSHSLPVAQLCRESALGLNGRPALQRRRMTPHRNAEPGQIARISRIYCRYGSARKKKTSLLLTRAYEKSASYATWMARPSLKAHRKGSAMSRFTNGATRVRISICRTPPNALLRNEPSGSNNRTKRSRPAAISKGRIRRATYGRKQVFAVIPGFNTHVVK